MKYDLSTWPEIDLRQVRSSFREVPLAAYPELAGFGRAGVHEELAGQGGLFLAERSKAPNILLHAVPGKEAFYRKLGFRKMTTAMGRFENPEAQRQWGYIE